MGRLTAVRGRLSTAPRRSAEPLARPSFRDRGYPARWDKTSKAFLRDHPLCRGCEAEGLVEASTLTAHVIPNTQGTPRFWDSAWWQPSYDWHHNAVKQLLERRYDAGEIGADDLWLDSLVAIETTARERAGVGGS